MINQNQSEFLSAFVTVEQICQRWSVCEKTIRNLEIAGDITPVVLPGKAHQKFFRISDIVRIESQLKGDAPAVDADVAARIEKSLAEIREMIARSNTPSIDADRRKAAAARLDDLVPKNDRYRPVIDDALKSVLDRDPTFGADQVPDFVAAERRLMGKITEQLTKERHAAAMDRLFGRPAAEKIKPAKLPKARPHDGFTVEDNYEVQECEISESVVPFEGFRSLDRGNEPTDDSTL